jgi:hypothetical protein
MSKLPLNWRVLIECLDCKTLFDVPVENVDPSCETVGMLKEQGPKRMLLVAVPQVCPECHNLREVNGE